MSHELHGTLFDFILIWTVYLLQHQLGEFYMCAMCECLRIRKWNEMSGAQWVGGLFHTFNELSSCYNILRTCSMIYSILNFHSHKSQMNTHYSTIRIVTHTISMTVWHHTILFCLDHYLTKAFLAKEKEGLISTIVEVVSKLY